ncbi:MAG: gliding motility-associated C-terminal domain-containing protein [Crocinitomicaceae bacterium]
MINTQTLLVWAVSLLLLSNQNVFGQATINVRVLNVEVTGNVDCDGFLTGNSDFAWEFLATDNTLGYSNNNPVLFGLLGDFNYAFRNGDNGPYIMNAPGGGFSPNSGLYFTHDYVCASDVPTLINIAWRAYENDDLIFNYALGLGGSDGETANQNVSMAVPGAAGVNWQIYTATSTDGGCNQTYRVTFEVERIDLAVIAVPDDICSALQVPLNVTQSFALCQSASLEPNEPAAADVAANGSSWLYFVAPAGGEVEITTDLAGTEIGTYFEVYHAADGVGCAAGIQPITGAVIKNKFDYLSHYQFSDGIDLFGIDPEAEIVLDACDPLAPFSYQKLIPGEVYYVQLTTDNAGESGFCEVRINDLGGGGSSNVEDIPCLSPAVTYGTAAISSAAGSGATVNLNFGCAYDGGNNFGETGSPHTSPNPNEYHAYDYDASASNNSTMNESVWLNFVAPNSGRLVFETDYQSGIYSEHSALFGFDKNFAPGIPADYNCADLENIAAIEGGLNGFLGGATESAIISQSCLEPGYTYYGMVDPSNSLTAFSAQNIDTWVHDPSVTDPINNPPGNDILCLTMLNPLYEVVVTPAGLTPPFQAVAGNNERACREYLAGEPEVNSDPTMRADQTVWHYFTVPPSGAIEMNIRAYIGLDTLRYSVYELLNGTDCYGGLNPATYTTDGTQSTPIIAPVLQGSAGFSGTQESICCMNPGTMYAIQLDGGSPGDEGQYIIEYIKEVESYAGDTYIELVNGDIIDNSGTDTAFVCFNDIYTPGNALNGIGLPTLDIPSCLTPGFVIHSNTVIPDPVSGSGFTYLDTLVGLNGAFVNNSDGSGSFGNPIFNTVYYVSSMADDLATWGDFSCNTSTVDNSVAVVFLEPVVPTSSYDNVNCEITFSATGGVSGYNGGDFTYTIEDASMNLVETGSFAAGANVIFAVTAAEVYTITVTDGSCPYSFTVDASACGNPCVLTPIIEFVNALICEGQTIFLEGANQTTEGLYTDVFMASNGCDSTIYTTVAMNIPSTFEQTVTICEGLTYTIGSNVYSTQGVYQDVFTAANLCDSIVTTNLFFVNTLNTVINESICTGTTYSFAGNTLNATGVYTDNLSSIGGCDSIITLYLNVEPLISISTTQTVCEGNSLLFGSQTLSTSGTYNELFTTSGGCDSLVTMYFFVNPSIESSAGVSICQGQTYVLGSQTLTVTGEYQETFVTPSGCDSIVTLFLNVSNQITNSITDSICIGEFYSLGSQTFTSSGVYSEVFQNGSGCDSLVTLDLSVLDCKALLEISNVCTPNDDGSNDTWKVSDLTQINGCNVKIFNRWGQLMYDTDDYQNDWDGTKNGEILPDGVYYYGISCDDEREYQGVINLMRYKK